MRKQVFYLSVIQSLLSVLILVGCEEHPYKVSIDGKVPPTFKINTIDSLYFIRILKHPAPESEIYPKEAGIWQIEINKNAGSYRYPIEIKYGVVPDGFIQKVPKDGSAPPVLEEWQEYLFFAPTSANLKGISFKIENGKSVILD